MVVLIANLEHTLTLMVLIASQLLVNQVSSPHVMAEPVSLTGAHSTKF